MLQERIEPAWLDAFETVLAQCGVTPGTTHRRPGRGGDHDAGVVERHPRKRSTVVLGPLRQQGRLAVTRRRHHRQHYGCQKQCLIHWCLYWTRRCHHLQW